MRRPKILPSINFTPYQLGMYRVHDGRSTRKFTNTALQSSPKDLYRHRCSKISAQRASHPGANGSSIGLLGARQAMTKLEVLAGQVIGDVLHARSSQPSADDDRSDQPIQLPKMSPYVRPPIE